MQRIATAFLTDLSAVPLPPIDRPAPADSLTPKTALIVFQVRGNARAFSLPIRKLLTGHCPIPRQSCDQAPGSLHTSFRFPPVSELWESGIL